MINSTVSTTRHAPFGSLEPIGRSSVPLLALRIATLRKGAIRFRINDNDVVAERSDEVKYVIAEAASFCPTCDFHYFITLI